MPALTTPDEKGNILITRKNSDGSKSVYNGTVSDGPAGYSQGGLNVYHTYLANSAKDRRKDTPDNNPTPRANPTVQANNDAFDIYNAMMGYLNARDSKLSSLIENFRQKGRDENAMNMNYALRQHKRTYGNGLNGQGLSNKFNIYARRSKDDQSVDENADQMMLSAKGDTYNSAYNLLNSAGANGLTAEQIRRLYQNM